MVIRIFTEIKFQSIIFFVLKRALKFLLVFVAATIVIVLAAGIPNYSAFKTLFSNTDGMREGYEYVEKTFSLKGLTEFIGEHPEYMSVVSFVYSFIPMGGTGIVTWMSC